MKLIKDLEPHTYINELKSSPFSIATGNAPGNNHLHSSGHQCTNSDRTQIGKKKPHRDDEVALRKIRCIRLDYLDRSRPSPMPSFAWETTELSLTEAAMILWRVFAIGSEGIDGG